MTRAQLLELGLSPKAIAHRQRIGRLHALHRGVYAVGRPELTREGRWMAAVLACGAGAALSHGSAGILWRLDRGLGRLEVSVTRARTPRRPGIEIHRRAHFPPSDITLRSNIPVTTPIRTLIDLAGCLSASRLEAAVNAADRYDLVDPEALRRALDERGGERGVRALRTLLDRDTFLLTDSELERRFLPIVRTAGLPAPEAQAFVAGLRVDFLFRELALVVESDGLRYHRTPAQQARDRERDQALFAAGLTTLRFTHDQVAHEPGYVEEVMRAALRRSILAA